MDPIVSVCCITYNHQRFIKKAIESFLMQKTNFPFEIILHDDCSTDGTAEIVRQYQEEHPDIIRAIIQTENQWSQGKKPYLITIEGANGKYLALCEGDDYWIDPNKLKKQVDYLERHPECSMCAHNTKVIDSQGEITREWINKPNREKLVLELADLLENYEFHTSSIMLRNGMIKEFPDWFYQLPMGDWPLQVLAAQHGKIGIIDEVMSVYRRHPGGSWISRSNLEKYQGVILFYETMYQNLDQKHHRKIISALSKKIKKAGTVFAEQGNSANLEKNVIYQNADNFLESLFINVSFNQFITNKLRRSFYAGFYGAMGFHHNSQGNTIAAAKDLMRASLNDILWLGNKGVWSVVGKSILRGNQKETIKQK